MSAIPPLPEAKRTSAKPAFAMMECAGHGLVAGAGIEPATYGL
jgi:hypothetical protein